MTCTLEKDGERVERTLGPRDAISVPAGVARSERNDGNEDALMLVIVGAGKPQLPTYRRTVRCTESSATERAVDQRIAGGDHSALILNQPQWRATAGRLLAEFLSAARASASLSNDPSEMPSSASHNSNM